MVEEFPEEIPDSSRLKILPAAEFPTFMFYSGLFILYLIERIIRPQIRSKSDCLADRTDNMLTKNNQVEKGKSSLNPQSRSVHLIKHLATDRKTDQ